MHVCQNVVAQLLIGVTFQVKCQIYLQELFITVSDTEYPTQTMYNLPAFCDFLNELHSREIIKRAILIGCVCPDTRDG